jgi:filamentous hemagglutinin
VAPSGELRLATVSYKNGREPGHDGGLIKVTSITDAITGAAVTNTLTGYAFGSKPVSQYDPANLLQLPTEITAMTLVSDVEVAKDGTGNAGRSAVIQAGGNVAITATKDLQNSVIHEDYASAGATNKVADTHANGTGQTVVVRLNAQRGRTPLTLQPLHTRRFRQRRVLGSEPIGLHRRHCSRRPARRCSRHYRCHRRRPHSRH